MGRENEQLAKQKIVQRKHEHVGGEKGHGDGGLALSSGDMQALQGMVGNTAVGQLGQIQRTPQNGAMLENASTAAFDSILGRGQTIQRTPANDQPAHIQRSVPSNIHWKLRSGKLFHDRSPALQGIDTALQKYNQVRHGNDNQRKDSFLAAIQDAILKWKAEKQSDQDAKFYSKRLEQVEWLEDRVENKRQRLGRAITEGLDAQPNDERGPDPAAMDFNKLSVHSMGTLSDDHDFQGATKDDYNAQNERLHEDEEAKVEGERKPISDVDIRLAMLEDKIREAHAEMGTQVATLNDPTASVVGLFTAAEWFFKRPFAPYSEADKTKIINAVRSMSATYQNMLIVPGTIMWGAGRDETETLNNTAVAIMNGRLIHQTNKFREGSDIKSYTRLLNAGEKANPDGNDAKAVQHEDFMQKKKNAWIRGGGAVTGKDHGTNQPDASIFQVGNLTMSVEVCADHFANRALNELEVPAVGENGVHVQILISHGAKLVQPGKATRRGGVAVSTDGGPGRDEDAGYEGPRTAKKYGGDNDQDVVQSTTKYGQDQFNQTFMDIFDLPVPPQPQLQP